MSEEGGETESCTSRSDTSLTCPEDQVNQQSSHILELGLVQVTKYITVVVNHRPEEGGHVVVLQHRLVIVDDGQVRGGLDMEVVGGPAVVVVVDDGGEEEGEDLQVGHPVLQSSLGDAAVSGLQDVAGVQVVVVGGSVTEMVRLY